MHELSIIEGIKRSVESQRAHYGFSKVKEIEIICGKYSCLSEDALQFCFDACVKASCMEGAQLHIRRRTGLYKCRDCGFDFDEAQADALKCSSCGSDKIITQVDQTIYIDKLEVE